MYNAWNSNPTVTNCTFEGNSASGVSSNAEGGGMDNWFGSSPTVTDCTFSGNTTGGYGGGMSNTIECNPTVTNCTFSGNSADDEGGGMSNGGSCYPTVTSCTFSENTAGGSGGGMFNFVSVPTVANCAFSKNSAGGSGGGMFNGGSIPRVTNCTFSGNTAGYSGGGMYSGSFEGHVTTVTNSILWNNSPNEIINEGASMIVTYCDIAGGRFGANIVCVPHRGLELPEYVVRRLNEEYGAAPLRMDTTDLGELARESDAVYITPNKPHQLSLFTDSRGLRVSRVDAVYMTRPQTERHGEGDSTEAYMRLGQRTMSAPPLREAIVMHPLPRRDEIAAEFDDDPRSLYFKQAERGVPIRMAILALLLGRLQFSARPPESGERPFPVEGGHNPCPNQNCITHTEERHRRMAFKLTSRDPLGAACAYCSQEIPIGLVGCSTTLHYHARDSAVARKIRPDHLIFFRDEAEALAQGFSAVR